MSQSGMVVGIERSGAIVRAVAPAVGLWSGQPVTGSAVPRGGRVGWLHVLNQRFPLFLPGDVGGTVVVADLPRRSPVEFGQELFRIVSVDEGLDSRTSHGPDAIPDTDGGLPEGTFAIHSPTDGVFHTRPAPDTSPFVEVGQRIRIGQPIGLVEVMKTFNQILYEGEGRPGEAQVVNICCGDAEEVGAGQALVILRALLRDRR